MSEMGVNSIFVEVFSCGYLMVVNSFGKFHFIVFELINIHNSVIDLITKHNKPDLNSH